jgi:hypothetical protein
VTIGRNVPLDEAGCILAADLDAVESIEMPRQINVSVQRICAAGNAAGEDRGAKIAQLICPRRANQFSPSGAG